MCQPHSVDLGWMIISSTTVHVSSHRTSVQMAPAGPQQQIGLKPHRQQVGPGVRCSNAHQHGREASAGMRENSVPRERRRLPARACWQWQTVRLTYVEDWHSVGVGRAREGGTCWWADVCHYTTCWRKETMQMKINVLCGLLSCHWQGGGQSEITSSSRPALKWIFFKTNIITRPSVRGENITADEQVSTSHHIFNKPFIMDRAPRVI